MHLPKYNDRQHRVKFGQGPMHWIERKPLSWYPCDTEELFDSNWNNPKTRKILIDNNWTKDSITYKSNDFGFRMPKNISEIEIGRCDFYLGCSHTFGIGLNLEDTWGWKLSQKRGLDFVNLGYPGGSIESQYRMLRSWAKFLQPKRAFTLGTYPGRREILRYDGVAERVGRWIKDGPLHIVFDRLCNDNEMLISTLRTIDAMKAVCLENNIELYSIDDKFRYDILPFNVNEKEKIARDLIHYGPQWHSRIADIPDSYWERLV